VGPGDDGRHGGHERPAPRRGRGSELDTEVSYGLPIGRRFVSTPRFGLRTSKHGRDYRLGYGVQVLKEGHVRL